MALADPLDQEKEAARMRAGHPGVAGMIAPHANAGKGR